MSKNNDIQRMVMTNENEIDLLELFFAIISRWKILLVVVVIGAITAGLYSRVLDHICLQQ